MADTKTEKKAATQSVSISVENLEGVANELKELDAKITAASGNDAQVRKAAVDEILAANADKVGSVYSQVIDQFKTLDGDTLVGLVAKLEEAMKGDLKTLTDEVINAKVAASAGEKVDVNALKESRKGKLESFRALKTILDSLGLDTTSVEEPKRSGGGRPAGSGSAKTGKNKENYQYTMDGEDRPASQNSFSSLAFYATVGLDESGQKVADGVKSKMSAKALRDYITTQGIKFGEQDTWEVTLNNGKKIGARRMAPVESTPTPAGEAPGTQPAPDATPTPDGAVAPV